MVFTSATPAAQTTPVNYESASNANVNNYPSGGSRSSLELFDHTDFSGTTYTYSHVLNGGNNSQVGVAKSYKVYPGDKVKIEAYAKYYNPQGSSTNLSGFAAALTAAFGVTSGSTGEAGQTYQALNDYGGFIAGGSGPGNGSFPKLFVNILVFDKDFNFLNAAYEQIDGGLQSGVSPKANHDYMSREFEVKEAGYVFAYISNENGTYVEGYFDDVAFTYTPSNIIQYNEYYPFGLQTASSWTRENTKDNRYLYNAGNELNQNSGWYEMFYRGYDPATGRMLQIDPYASSYTSLTPYNYGANNPIMLNDPSGGKVNVPYDVSMSYSQYTMMYGDPNIVGGGSGGGFFRSSYMNSARDAAMDRAENYGNEVVEFGGGVEGLAAGLNYLFLGGYLNGINNFTFEYNGTNYGGFYELENGVVTSVSYSEVTLHESGGWVSNGDFTVVESTQGDGPDSQGDFVYDNNNAIGLGIGILESGFGAAWDAVRASPNSFSSGAKVISKVGGAGLVVANVALTGYTITKEIQNGDFNTHSIVNGTVTTIGVGLTAVGLVVSAPAVVIIGAGLGIGYGIAQLAGFDDWIDAKTDNWGKKLIE